MRHAGRLLLVWKRSRSLTVRLSGANLSINSAAILVGDPAIPLLIASRGFDARGELLSEIEEYNAHNG